MKNNDWFEVIKNYEEKSSTVNVNTHASMKVFDYNIKSATSS